MELKIKFKTFEELREFAAIVAKAKGNIDEVKDIDSPVPFVPTASAAATPAVPQAPAAAKPQRVRGAITKKQLAELLAQYKEATDHAHYKELLGRYQASTQREIPVEAYSEIKQYIESVLAGAPVAQPPAQAPEQQALGAPEVTRAMLDQALQAHAQAYGPQRTMEIVNSCGVSDIHAIPAEKFSSLAGLLGNNSVAAKTFEPPTELPALPTTQAPAPSLPAGGALPDLGGV